MISEQVVDGPADKRRGGSGRNWGQAHRWRELVQGRCGYLYVFLGRKMRNYKAVPLPLIFLKKQEGLSINTVLLKLFHSTSLAREDLVCVPRNPKS